MSVLGDHLSMVREVLNDVASINDAVQEAAFEIAQSLYSGGKLLAAGNGGSAAEAQHLTAELLGRLHPARERRPLAAVALHAETSTITAIANDYGYDQIFSRQVAALGGPNDVLVALSTSGGSQNLVNAVDVANELGMVTIGLLGAGNRALHRNCKHVLAVPSDSLQTIQVFHLVLVHVLVEEAEDRLAVLEAGPASG